MQRKNLITSLRDRTLTASNITAHLDQCREKLCQHILRGREGSLTLAYTSAGQDAKTEQ